MAFNSIMNHRLPLPCLWVFCAAFVYTTCSPPSTVENCYWVESHEGRMTVRCCSWAFVCRQILLMCLIEKGTTTLKRVWFCTSSGYMPVQILWVPNGPAYLPSWTFSKVAVSCSSTAYLLKQPEC